MAIAAMKKVTLVAMKQDRHKLLSRMQRLGCVEVSARQDDAPEQTDDADMRALDACEAQLARLDSAIKTLSRYDKRKKGLFAQRPVLDESGLSQARAEQDNLFLSIARLEEIDRTIAQLTARKARLAAQIAQWQPWSAFHVPLEQVRDSAHTRMWLGTVEKHRIGSFMHELTGQGAIMREIGIGREGVYVFIVLHSADEEALLPALKNAGFTRAQFTELTGTFEQNIRHARNQIQQAQEQQQQLEQEQAAMADLLLALRVAYDMQAVQRDRLHMAQRLAATRSAVVLEGWAPAEKTGVLQEAIHSVSPDTALFFQDPDEEDKPPVLLKNNWFASQFEGVVQMFSLPEPRSLDPAAIMGPFFLLFFGMMVSDAGYGVVLSLLTLGFLLLVKPGGMTRQIAGILMMGGISTLFWGVMFGGWFGISVTPVLVSPMENPMDMLILCFALGLVHLFVGLGTGIYMNIKRGKYLDALFDQGFWILLVGGLVMLLLPQTSSIGQYLAPIGGVGIILTAKRGSGGSLIKRLLGGLGALYNISGYLSDVLSYARLFGMGLATGIIGMVINTIAGMLMGNPIGAVLGVLILIGGHSLNLAINVLGAYVHACRLQYIEFFGKFYESGGTVFRPLRMKTRYVTIQGDNL